MPHGPGGSVHSLLSYFWIDHPHPDDPSQELLVWIGWLRSPEPLKFFMVKKGLYPEIVVHSQGLEFLGKGKVSKDHIMNLGRAN